MKTKREIIVSLLSSLCVYLLSVGVTQADSGELSQLESLMKEAKEIEVEKVEAVKESTDLADKERALTGAWEMIKTAKSRLQNDSANHSREVNYHNRELNSLESEGRNYDAQGQPA